MPVIEKHETATAAVEQRAGKYLTFLLGRESLPSAS